jgi:hypothetical protein
MEEDGDRDANDSTQSGVEAFTHPARVERRVWRNSIAVISTAILAAALFADLKFLLGLILGGLLALLNYRWLHSSLRAALATGAKTAAPGAAMKFVFRWVVIGLVVYAANLTGYFEPIAMLAGLFAPAVAIMIEAALVTYRAIGQGGE